MDCKKNENGMSTMDNNNPERSMRRSMSCDQFVDGPISSSFLVNLFREQGITDVNLVSDNAKPRATVPRSVFLQNDREDKSISRWASIPRTESLDALDSYTRSRRRTTSNNSGQNWRPRTSYSLSPTGIPQKLKALPEDFEKSISSLKHNNLSQRIPPGLRNTLMEIVRTDDACKTSEEKLNHTASLVTDSKPPLRMPQRRAFIDSQHSTPSRPRRAGRRPSNGNLKSVTKSSSNCVSLDQWWNLSGHENELAKDGNGTISTHELTPSPNSAAEAAAKILKISNYPIKAPPLNTPPPISPKIMRLSKSTGSLQKQSKSKSKKSQRAKSPPHQLPATPPALRSGHRKSMNSKRPKSPPPQRPGTPPALPSGVRARRHSDSIINIDMEVSKKLLHLAQISSPVQPVRRASFESVEYVESDQEEEEEVQPSTVKARKDGGTTSPEDNNTQGKRSEKEPKDDQISPRSKVHFASQVKFSPSQPKKTPGPRVSFSPRRQHSAPLSGMVARRDDDSESALLASYQRIKPFSPGSAFTKTAVVSSKMGTIIRSRTNAARTSNNRDIVKASCLVHGSDGDRYLDNFIGHSSMGSLEMSSMVDFLATPSLETPPSKRRGKQKKSGRRTSMPNIPQLPSGSPEQKNKNTSRSPEQKTKKVISEQKTKKKKKSKRQSVDEKVHK